MWNEPNTSTPARLPVGSGTQTLKLAADIRTTCQPSPRRVRSAARLSRTMSKGCVCRLIQATSASESWPIILPSRTAPSSPPYAR